MLLKTNSSDKAAQRIPKLIVIAYEKMLITPNINLIS